MKYLALFPAALALSAMVQDSPVVLQHGQWSFTTRFGEVEMPGQSAELVEGVRAAIDQPQTQTRCMSREEAANPAANLASPGGSAENCVFSRRVFENGRIDVAGNCPAPAGAIRIALGGNYTATEIDARIQADVESGTPMRMRGTFSARRIGDCAPEASANPS